jgi:predicted protein tyrosine phosphatase
MAIWVSSLAEAPNLAARHKPALIVSLLSPYDSFPVFPGHDTTRHLRVPIHDIAQDIGQWRAPGARDAENVVRFVETWDQSAPLLIHCWAGISRSTASAFIAACIHNPRTDEEEIAMALRAASPTASPNVRLVAHADDLLGRRGRMSAAVSAIGRGQMAEEALPFFIPAAFPSRP